MSNFKRLIEYYADGKPICNCGDAYYSACGHGFDGLTEKHDMLTCEYGCSANQINAKEYIAGRVIEDLIKQRHCK